MNNSEPSTPNILIQTKLALPRLSRDFLPRPHLMQRLENGHHRKLTLISAPAGYGKSTMTSAWWSYAIAGRRGCRWIGTTTIQGRLAVTQK